MKNNPPEQQVFITDLDGTLLNSQGVLSTESVQLLHAIATTTPHKIAFATARGLLSARKVIGQVPWNFPVLLNNGAVIYDWQNQEVRDIRSIPPACVSHILEVGAKQGLSPFIFTLNEQVEEGIFFQANPNTGMQMFLAQRPNDPRFVEVAHLATHAMTWHKPSLVLMFIADYDALVPVKLYLQKQMGKEVNCLLLRDQYIPNQFVLEVSSAHATKENGIQLLQRVEAIDDANLHVFGDNLNDKGMLSLAANTYAVANAHPDLLNRAKNVIPSNDQGGVLQTIQRIIKEKETL